MKAILDRVSDNFLFFPLLIFGLIFVAAAIKSWVLGDLETLLDLLRQGGPWFAVAVGFIVLAQSAKRPLVGVIGAMMIVTGIGSCVYFGGGPGPCQDYRGTMEYEFCLQKEQAESQLPY